MTTRAQLEGVMSLAADLMADGQAVAAERLLRLFASDQSVEPAPDPSTETLSAIERKRLRDREYAAKRRLVAKKSSVVVSESSDESSDESSQKSSATSLSRAFSEEAEEEKRKLCDSRQFSAESESLSLPESSELRAREETTSRQKSSASVVASPSHGRSNSVNRAGSTGSARDTAGIARSAASTALVSRSRTVTE